MQAVDMMLDYEWANPAAAAAAGAAAMLFGEGCDGREEIPAMFEQYDGHGFATVGEFFEPPAEQLNTAALFSTAQAAPANAAECGQRYGLGLPPAPALAPVRIGLNLGVRTYFSSASPEEEMGLGRVCRRRTKTARCQSDGCVADLTHSKHYHRRHKVCEFHSKASIVIAAGLSQRFCQQCSRFHVLSEFDQGKRSCRKRLADHNLRRRKSQDLTAISTAQSNNSTTTNVAGTNAGTTAVAGVAILKNHSIKREMAPLESSNSSNMNNNNRHGTTMDGNAQTASTVTRISSPAPAVPAIALGLGCCSSGINVSHAAAGISGSSSTGTSPATVSFFSHLADFLVHEHRFLNWDDDTKDGTVSLRSLYENKQ